MEKESVIPDDLDWTRARHIAVQQAVDSRDLAGLRAWSKEPGGFGSSAIRRTAWTFLLGVTESNLEQFRNYPPCTDGEKESHLSQESRDGTGESLVDIAAMIEQENTEASCTAAEVPSDEVVHALHEVEPHPDERQVGLDTRRSFVYYPTNLHSREKTRLQEELNEVIITVLRKRKALSYFQGYHDIISVLYLTFLPYEPPQRSRSASRSSSPSRSRERTRASARPKGRTASKSPMTVFPPDETDSQQARRGSADSQHGAVTPTRQSRDTPEWRMLVACCDAISLVRVRDGMTKGLAPVIGYLRLFKRVLKAADPELAKIVLGTSPTPYFALSWMLTLFSHDINTLEPVQRIFDFLLARNPAVVIYLGVAIVLLKKDRLLKLAHTMDDDPGIIHTNLALLPPLIADSPGDMSRTMDSEQIRAQEAAIKLLEDSTIYPEVEGSNPHKPIILSELFTLTDSLWARFPLHHLEVRADEIMASGSAIFTYMELEKELNAQAATDDIASATNRSSQEIASWVSVGPFNEEDIVVVPAPEDSEEEDDEPSARPPLNREPNKLQNLLRRRILGRTSLALLVLVLGIGIAAYQARHKRGLTGLWAFPGLFLNAGARGVLSSQAGAIGTWLVSGRIRLGEVIGDVKSQVQFVLGAK